MPALPSNLLPALRRHRGLAALMLMILASTPIWDGGCLTYAVVSTSQKEKWDDLHAPCAAYAGADGSLTLVLPDGEDLNKAQFYAVRFTAEEVKAAAQVAEPAQTGVTAQPKTVAQLLGGQPQEGKGALAQVLGAQPQPPHQEETPLALPLVSKEDPTQAGPNRIPFGNPAELNTPHAGPLAPAGNLRLGQVNMGAGPYALNFKKTLTFTPSRDAPRVSPLPGTTAQEWERALPVSSQKGCWLRSQPGTFPPGRMAPNYNMFTQPNPLPTYWDLDAYTFERQGGTHMAPTAGMWLVPVTVVADVVTLPIQLVVVVVAVATSK